MAVLTSAPTISTTATALGESRARRVLLLVEPPASGTVYIGGADVTSSNGRPLAAGDDPFLVQQAFEEDLTPTEAFYAVTASSTATVRVLEIRK